MKEKKIIIMRGNFCTVLVILLCHTHSVVVFGYYHVISLCNDYLQKLNYNSRFVDKSIV